MHITSLLSLSTGKPTGKTLISCTHSVSSPSPRLPPSIRKCQFSVPTQVSLLLLSLSSSIRKLKDQSPVHTLSPHPPSIRKCWPLVQVPSHCHPPLPSFSQETKMLTSCVHSVSLPSPSLSPPIRKPTRCLPSCSLSKLSPPLLPSSRTSTHHHHHHHPKATYSTVHTQVHSFHLCCLWHLENPWVETSCHTQAHNLQFHSHHTLHSG